jgi:hypothetical protein
LVQHPLDGFSFTFPVILRQFSQRRFGCAQVINSQRCRPAEPYQLSDASLEAISLHGIANLARKNKSHTRKFKCCGTRPKQKKSRFETHPGFDEPLNAFFVNGSLHGRDSYFL